jgi:hypothetical protein
LRAKRQQESYSEEELLEHSNLQQRITNNWDINGETLVTVVKKENLNQFEQIKKKYGSR